jgi:hypothetical protein
MKNLIKDLDGNVIGFNVNQDCDFIREMQNPNNSMMVGENRINRAYYNLLVTIRDLNLYSKGLLPHRHWKITPVKKYFGWQHKDNGLFLEYLEEIKRYLNSSDESSEISDK